MLPGGVEGLEGAAEAEADLFGVFILFFVSLSLGLGGSTLLKLSLSSDTHSSNLLLYSKKWT